MNTTNSSFQVLPQDEVHQIYKKAYQQLRQKTRDYYLAYQDKTQLQDTPDVMKELLNLTIMCNRFNLNIQETLQNALKTNTLSQLKEFSTLFKKKAISYRFELKRIESRGLLKRKELLTVLPEVFQKTGRVYLKTTAIQTECQIIQDTLTYINAFLPISEQYQLKQEFKEIEEKTAGGAKKTRSYTQYFLQEKKQAFKIGRFLSSAEKQIAHLHTALQSASLNTQKSFLSLLNEMPNYTQAQSAFRIFKKEHHLPSSCSLSALIFYQLKSIQKETINSFLKTLLVFQEEYALRNSLLHEIQIKPLCEKKTQESIDMLIFSVRPVDLSTMSTFTDWDSCMSIGKKCYNDLHKQIAVGSVIVYGVNSSNPDKKLSRLILRPYFEKNTLRKIKRERLKVTLPLINPFTNKVFNASFLYNNTVEPLAPDNLPLDESVKQAADIFIPSKAYGLQTPMLKEIVSLFAHTHLNKIKTSGTFYAADDFYLDGLEPFYTLSNAQDFFKIAGIENSQTPALTNQNTLSVQLPLNDKER